ncbi:MAG: mycothione reductase [Nostocoides sp.]
MSLPRHHDLIIIGTGSGNSLITPELEGLDIAIVEAGTFGGTCLNVGCIPTKMYVVVADVLNEIRYADRLGIRTEPAAVDWPAVRDRIFGRIDPIASGGEDYRRNQDFVTVYDQHARFVAERQVQLSDGSQISADQVVVAAGSRPSGLDAPGLRSPDPAHGLHTSDTIMRLDSLPSSMIVLGGGFVACEMANVFAAFGVEVTQVQRSPVLLRHEEAAVAQRYTEMARTRYTVRAGTQVLAAEHQRRPDGDDLWRITVEECGVSEVLEAQVVLLAVGRTPNGDQLDALDGGLAMDTSGRIIVDDHQRTTAAGTWALGDVCSPWELKHVANHEARVVAHNLAVTFGRSDAELITSDHRFVPHSVFGFPQIAAFGPTADELDAAGIAYVSKTQDYADVAYGWALEECQGFLTVHATPQGRILAGHCLGPMAATLIQPLIQAASFGQHAVEVARGQYWIHPALAEVVENALLGLPLEPVD